MLLAGEEGEARERLRETVELYRRSWEEAGPRSFGRLIGMIKAAVLAGGGGEEAAYAREALGDARRGVPARDRCARRRR
jgi:hypothetical protein